MGGGFKSLVIFFKGRGQKSFSITERGEQRRFDLQGPNIYFMSKLLSYSSYSKKPLVVAFQYYRFFSFYQISA